MEAVIPQRCEKDVIKRYVAEWVDRLSIHQSSDEWDWKDYHRRYVELLVEKGLA